MTGGQMDVTCWVVRWSQDQILGIRNLNELGAISAYTKAHHSRALLILSEATKFFREEARVLARV